MGTTYHVKYYGSDRDQIAAEVELVLERVNNSMSTYRPYSELSKINHSKGEDWISLSSELNKVITKGIELSRMSDGRFDITLGPLVNLWGFGPSERAGIPTALEIAKAKKRVGYQKIVLDRGRLKKKEPKLYIDLSAIAKGFGVDQVAELLRAKGVSDYMVEIGGEVRTSGSKNGTPWSIAIQKPDSSGGIDYVLKLQNYSVATSGDYRNFFIRSGKKYSHTIDSDSGKPVQNDLTSVTVITEKSCMHADGMATMLLAMGFEKASEFVDKNGIMSYMIKRSDTKLTAYRSPRFRKVFGD